MITEKEKKFLRYWEANKDIENRFLNKMLGGLPMAILFGLPVILSVVVVRIFFPDWYMKISQTTPGMFISAIIAVVCIVLFYSFFRMQYKWEMNDQLYQELKYKENKENNNIS
ncbi:MAG TPA: hypothetical protein VK559_10230 [Ferruginibacter sp.]|nr:hypothetical protein [Ferruginibacter sp.]